MRRETFEAKEGMNAKLLFYQDSTPSYSVIKYIRAKERKVNLYHEYQNY
jgi:hypothetical protein